MEKEQIKKTDRDVIGMIPAAGQAARLAPLPFSKELFPIGLGQVGTEKHTRPKPACIYLLEKFRWAGINKAFIILRSGKWDIPAYLGDGTLVDMHLAYLMMGLPHGAPYSVDQAYPYVKNATIALGFPDILFSSTDVYSHLLEKLFNSKADVVLGVFPADRSDKVDMVDMNQQGGVKNIVIKPSHTTLRYTWGTAVWSPIFTEFLHSYLANRSHGSSELSELHIGDVILAAIETGLQVEALQVSEKPFIDVGTPDDLVRAIQLFTTPPVSL
jgi:glucose-1-phosphate thymidylyltransferase